MSPFMRILLQLLVLALGIVLVVGSLNPFGANGQKLTLEKDAGVVGVPVLTEPVGTGAMVWVKVSADQPVEVRLIRMSERELDVPQDEVLRDNAVEAKGKGSLVELSSQFPTNYPFGQFNDLTSIAYNTTNSVDGYYLHGTVVQLYKHDSPYVGPPATPDDLDLTHTVEEDINFIYGGAPGQWSHP